MTEEELADEAAELDEPSSEGAAAGPDGPTSATYTGQVWGGPWARKYVTVRCPGGFLLVDRPRKLVWIYDRRENGDFMLRGQGAQRLNDEGRWTAAESDEYDVRALDPAEVAR